jgi:hypothetical protein
MRNWTGKYIAVLSTAFMVMSTIMVLTQGASDESGTGSRMDQPGPVWNAGDYWRYEYKQRSIHYYYPITFNGTLPGTANFSGTADHYEHYSVKTSSSGEFYEVDYVIENWENGTYVLVPDGYQPSTFGDFNIHSKVMTTTSQQVRKADLATGKVNTYTELSENYTATNYGGFDNSTLVEAGSLTAAGGYLGFYKFPLDFSLSWQISGETVTRRNGTRTIGPHADGTTDTILYDVNDTLTYVSGLGKTDTQANSPPQDTPSGTYDDCFRMDLSYSTDYRQSGSMSQNNGPQQPIDYSENGIYTSTTRWYSNKAGNIVNYNSTQQSNGLLLTDHHYNSIPPNRKPGMDTLAGKQYAPDLAPIPVREGEPTPIEITVWDQDGLDTLNWSVVSVVGALSNPQGTVLMDGTPAFIISNPTEGNLNQIHLNKLVITARQPKTVDSDEYTITVKVEDGHDGGDLTFAFKVNVQNINNRPYLAMPVPDIPLLENSTMTCTTWKLTDIFRDQDLDAGISDPLTFTAIVTGGPPIDLSIDPGTGFATFITPDYSGDPTPLPTWNSTIKFTCTDSGSGAPSGSLSSSTFATAQIEHVNHAPVLSANGTDLAESGLVWMGDQSDTRLDLNRAFFDPDIRYADDKLNFSWSGEKFINVTNTDGRITLTPVPYWNGKDNIQFRATDSLGRSRELRLDCTVLAVNHAPYFCETIMEIKWTDKGNLTIKEADSPDSANNRLVLEVSVKDPDTIYGTDTHQTLWVVKDNRNATVYRSPGFVLDEDSFEFRAAFTGPFSSDGSPYTVEAIVKDSGGLMVSYMWNVTVDDRNRPPSSRIDSPAAKKSFSKGTRIFFNASNTTDADESPGPDGRPNIDNLIFIWNSSKQGTLHKDRGMAGAQFYYDTLKPGRHIITLTVLDRQGGESRTEFEVTVNDPTPGFGASAFLLVAAAAALLLGRRRKA